MLLSRCSRAGRCLTLMQCAGNDADLNTCKHVCSLSGSHSVVVLDICSDSSDGCGGKSQQWIGHPDAGKPGYGEFESALGNRCLNAAMNPAEVEGFSLIVWNCALGSCRCAAQQTAHVRPALTGPGSRLGLVITAARIVAALTARHLCSVSRLLQRWQHQQQPVHALPRRQQSDHVNGAVQDSGRLHGGAVLPDLQTLRR
eukprot:SAG22_NODE_560_length_9102_cov_54.310785_6_plen_200_part_00